MLSSSLNQSSRSSIRWKSSRSSGCRIGPSVRLGELGRESPDLHADAGRDEQVDDALAGALRHRDRAGRAPERVRARSSSEQTRTTRSFARSCTSPQVGQLARMVVTGRPLQYSWNPAIGRAPRALEVESTRLGRTHHDRVRGDHVRPPRSARRTAGEHTLRRFERALELGARGSRATRGCPPTARSCSCTTPRSGGVCARSASRRRRRPSCRELDVPRLADLYATCGTEYELSIDAKEPAVIASHGRGRSRRGRRRAGRLWICSPVLEDAPQLRRGGARRRKLVHSPGYGGLAPAAMSATAPTSRPRASTPQPAPLGLDARDGRARPPVRAARVRVGHAGDALHPRGVAARDRRRVLRPGGPHGRRRRRVGLTAAQTDAG